MAIGERVKRLKAFSGNMAESARIGRDIPGMGKTEMDLRLEEEVSRRWPRLEECFTQGLEESAALDERNRFLAVLQDGRTADAGYVETIQSLDENALSLGTAWLQGVVDRITREAFDAVPLCK